VSRVPIRLLAACLLAAQCANAADPSDQPIASTATDRPARLEDLDEGIRMFRQLPWDFLEYAGQRPPDHSGRSVEDDVNEYILTAPVLEKIGSMRDKLAASYPAGTSIPSAELQPLQRVMQSEACRLTLLVAYWGTQRQQEYHRDMIRQLIERLPTRQQAEASQELQHTEDRMPDLRLKLPAAMDTCRNTQLSEVNPQLQPLAVNIEFQRNATIVLDELNALRRKLAAQYDYARVASGAAEHWTTRSIPCPAPATDTTGKPVPGYRARPDVVQYYPPDARNMDVSGIAKARVQYDDTGCITAVTIVESTGSEELDTAAARYLFDVALVPGERDGRASGGYVVIPIRFSLRN
jgi:TonB family protein